MDNVLETYRNHFNLQDAVFTLIEHDDSIVAIVYKVSIPNRGEYILKICALPIHYSCEVFYLKYFADILPVPRILETVEPNESINGAILMEYLPGDLIKVSDITDNQSYEVGSLLARIHSTTQAGYGDLTQPNSLSVDPAFHFTQKFEEGLNECRQHLPSELLDKCRENYNAYTQLLISSDGPCITHRDFRPGNILVNAGKVQGIIDWSGARSSFAEEDFYPLGMGEWSADDSHKDSFLKGYASIRPVPDYEKMMPLLRLNKAIATIGFTVKTGTWETKNASLYRRYRHSLEKLVSINR